MKIPSEIVTAASSMLSPYGIDLKELLRYKTASESIPKDDDARQYLSIADTVKDFGIGRWTIWRLIKGGKIKASKLSASRSGKVLVNKKSLQDYLRTQSN